MTRIMASRRRLPRAHVTGCLAAKVVFDVFFCIGLGCAALSRDLQSEGAVRLELAPSEIARVSRVRVYGDDGDFFVYGQIARKAGVTGREDATVRVVVRFPDGRMVEATKRAFPPYLPIRRSRKSNFSVRFPGLPPAGTVVRVECPPVPVSTPACSSPAIVFQGKESRP